MCKLLLEELNARRNPRDRWQRTPLDDAQSGGHGALAAWRGGALLAMTTVADAHAVVAAEQRPEGPSSGGHAAHAPTERELPDLRVRECPAAPSPPETELSPQPSARPTPRPDAKKRRRASTRPVTSRLVGLRGLVATGVLGLRAPSRKSTGPQEATDVYSPT